MYSAGEKTFARANTSGLSDILDQGGEVPSEGTSLLLMAALTGGTGSQAERVAMELLDRIRLSRAPHTKYGILSGPHLVSMDRPFFSYFREVMKDP